MANDISLTLEERQVTGKAVKHLRKAGKVPGVIHDHGKPSIHVMGDYLTLIKAYHQAGKHHPLQLRVGDKSFTALIKTAEFEPRKNQLNHLVFGAVKADEKVTAEIPIHIIGEVPAEKLSLIVINQLDHVEVEALPRDLPDELTVDAAKLVDIGDKVTVEDIVAPSGVTILTELEHTIATVYEPSALAAANDAAGGDAEPEDAKDVESEEGSAEADDQEGQAEELNPGGKKAFEDHTQATEPEKH